MRFFFLIRTDTFDDLIEYEFRLNDVLSKFDDVVICAYDLTKFGASTIVDVIRSHPAVLIGESFHENPFYAGHFAGNA